MTGTQTKSPVSSFITHRSANKLMVEGFVRSEFWSILPDRVTTYDIDFGATTLAQLSLHRGQQNIPLCFFGNDLSMCPYMVTVRTATYHNRYIGFSKPDLIEDLASDENAFDGRHGWVYTGVQFPTRQLNGICFVRMHPTDDSSLKIEVTIQRLSQEE